MPFLGGAKMAAKIQKISIPNTEKKIFFEKIEKNIGFHDLILYGRGAPRPYGTP